MLQNLRHFTLSIFVLLAINIKANSPILKDTSGVQIFFNHDSSRIQAFHWTNEGKLNKKLLITIVTFTFFSFNHSYIW